MPIKIIPMSERFGAEISGVDIAQPLSLATQDAIRKAQDEWGVTVWRIRG